MTALTSALSLALLLIFSAIPAGAGETTIDSPRPVDLASATDSALAAEPAAVVADEASYRGCCSWHSGVCGCYGIRVVYCDGRLSPSCLCRDVQPLTSLMHDDQVP